MNEHSEQVEQPEQERALIERALAGDKSAEGELLMRHLPGLHAWVRLKRSRLLRDRESSLDLVQSVFRQAIGDLHRFTYRGSNGFRNWLLTYAENKLSNRERYYRAACRSPTREAHESLSQVYASICSPSRAMDAKEQVLEFERAFSQLSATDQRIIFLAKFEARPHVEIAAELGFSEDASKQALKRALVRLSMRMAEGA